MHGNGSLIFRLAIIATVAVLAASGLALGYIALIALRRSEGVFLPAGYAAVMCLAGAAYLLRVVLRF